MSFENNLIPESAVGRPEHTEYLHADGYATVGIDYQRREKQPVGNRLDTRVAKVKSSQKWRAGQFLCAAFLRQFPREFFVKTLAFSGAV